MYVPKHTKEEYYDLIKSEEVEFCRELDDGLLEHFSVISQHVKGETWEECLDQIWDAVERRKERIEHYKTLPTLEAIVYSDIEINPKEMYNFRYETDPEDSCGGYSGDIILRMRQVGIASARMEMEKKFWKTINKNG